jgi:signal transduction histidine kinase
MFLAPVVQAVVDALTPSARAKGLAMTLRVEDREAQIAGDAQRLQQVVTNLVSNAIKFTRAGTIDVSIERDGAELVVRVVDQGIGFDETFARDLFQPFRQADASFRREFGGLGLGLSIARHIAELHGGSLTGSSPGPHAGATFELRLPLLSPGTKGAKSAPAASFAR